MTALIFWMMFIAVFSLMPLDSRSPDFLPQQDKLFHILAYAVLSWLIFAVKSNQAKVSALCWSAGIAIFYGCVIEGLQALVNTGRYFEYFDIIANIIGSFTGSLVYYFTRKN